VPALANALQIKPTGRKPGLPGDHGGKRALGVVVVPVRRFAQHAVQIGARGDAAVSVFRILLGQSRARLDQLLLFGPGLQAIGLGVHAVAHQVGQGQHDANQHFFVIFAGVGPLIVVQQIGQRGFGQVVLFQMIESVADLSQGLLGHRRTAGEQLGHRQIEFDDIAVFARFRQELLELQHRLLGLPAEVQLAADADAVRMRRAARGGGYQQQPNAGTSFPVGQGPLHQIRRPPPAAKGSVLQRAVIFERPQRRPMIAFADHRRLLVVLAVVNVDQFHRQ
jgi:hypothetical protein